MSGLDRRSFLLLTAAGLAAGRRLTPPTPRPAASRRPRAVAFDGFAIFDPRPIAALAEALFPGRGRDLVGAWRTRQFEYQWLRALSDRYADFWQVTEESLLFAARSLRIELDVESRTRLMQAHLALEAWPDVPAALQALREAGLRLAILSNMTSKMLTAGIEQAGLSGVFEQVLSTDVIRSYKPAPRAYRLAVDAFHLEPAEILFVAFAGWDAVGARWFGYPTYWANRLDLPAEELGAQPDHMGRDLAGLPGLLLREVPA
jgi:2-haloacid dehalogenase